MPVARAREIICPVCGLFVWTWNLDWACSILWLEIEPYYSQIILLFISIPIIPKEIPE